jgi:hypothetical protein
MIVILVLTMLVGQCFAASAVATISSTQPVVVSGITVPTNRVISWPVGVNDEIATQGAPAMVRFADGSVVTLQRNSRMRLEPASTGVEVKMLSGSAIYDVKAKSAVSFGPAINPRAVSAAGTVPAVNAAARTSATSTNEAQAVALAYRMPATAPKNGMVFAPTALGTGTFIPANVHFETTTVGGGPHLTLPSGAIFEGHIVTQGNISTFIIDKIEVPVTTPTGQISYVTANDPTLLGATVQVNGGQIQITPAGSTTPLPGTQVSQLIQNAATTSYNSSVANGQLPPNTTPPQPPSPISTGTFSGVS